MKIKNVLHLQLIDIYHITYVIICTKIKDILLLGTYANVIVYP